MYIYTETLLDLYVCRYRCLKTHRNAFHNLHTGEQRKPTEVKVENLISNSIITSDTPHPPAHHSSASRNASVAQVSDQRHWRSCWDATDRAHNSAKTDAGCLDLGLPPDMAAAPFQSCINGIPQQNERTLQVVNKFCMTLQVYALLAFQICSGDLVSRNVLPDSCKGILHNGYEK